MIELNGNWHKIENQKEVFKEINNFPINFDVFVRRGNNVLIFVQNENTDQIYIVIQIYNTAIEIIHDTKGEIASLYNLCPEIEELDKSKAMEIQATLDKIQKAFNNLHQVKDSIQPLKEELRHEVFNLMADIEAHEKFKYRHMENLVLEFNLSQINKEKLKLDSSPFHSRFTVDPVNSKYPNR